MIHTVNTISIRTYGEVDRTGNLSLLKRWFNVFPIRFFNVQNLITKIGQGLNTGVDAMLINEVAKMMLYNKILLLEALHMAIYNLIVLKPDNDQWGVTKNKKTNLGEYLVKVKELAQIEIKDLLGLGKLGKEVQRLKDKYQERFNEQPKKGEAIPFTQYAYSVFVLMEMPYNGETKMSEFFELVKLAGEKSKQLEKLKNG